MKLPVIGNRYVFIKDEKWIVEVTDINLTPMFSDEPLIYVEQVNGGNFFGRDFFMYYFKPIEEKEGCCPLTKDLDSKDTLTELDSQRRSLEM